MADLTPLSPDHLRWQCNPALFDFETTDQLESLDEVLGQERALKALEFGVSIGSHGFNLYALAPDQMDAHEVIGRVLERHAAQKEAPGDWCYVEDFEDSDKPRALALPRGRGVKLRNDFDDLIDDLEVSLPAALESDDFLRQRQKITEQFEEKQERALGELEAAASERDVAVIRTPMGVAFAPLRDREVLGPAELDQMCQDERDGVECGLRQMREDFEELLDEVNDWEQETRTRVRELSQSVAHYAIEERLDQLRERWHDLPEVLDHIDAVARDLDRNALELLDAKIAEEQGMMLGIMATPDTGRGPFDRYRVNLFIDNRHLDGAPIVYEDNPTVQRLLGRVEHRVHLGALITDFRMVRSGALHRANGGYLVLDAAKVLMNTRAWEQLKRALKDRRVDIESLQGLLGMSSTVALEPEPIELDLKVVLVGDHRLYEVLSALDPEFSRLFKVAADFQERVPRDHSMPAIYARMIARLARREGLLPFDAPAVAALIEHSARMAGDREKLAAETEPFRDLVREASHWARLDGEAVAGQAHVRRAVDEQIYRGARIQDEVQEAIERHFLFIDTEGSCVGQVNGLAVVQRGGFAFGKPSRITAQVHMGDGKLIDIEREVALGGPIHSKGIFILAGLIGGRYATDQPLSLAASLVFEQSYSGVEGDSASLAEACALLSVLAGAPLHQSMAVTGSINQHGEVQPVGGINEKIEGFFDVCKKRNGGQPHGVIIPAANTPHLMLRPEVLDAVARERFCVWAVDTIDEAVELLTDTPAGRRDKTGSFPADSVNGRVQRRLADLAEGARRYGSEH